MHILDGPREPKKIRAVDTETIETLLKRLSKTTRQPAYFVEEDSNFDVLIVNEDERDAMLASLSRNKATLEPKVQNF